MKYTEIDDRNRMVAVAYKGHVWDDRINIYIRAYGHVSGIYAPKELDFENVESDYRDQPIMELGITQAQALMDSLWDCGIRPTQGKGSAGAMDATQRHLNDMRGIVSKLLKIKL